MILATVVEEDDVGDNGRLCRLCWASTDTVETGTISLTLNIGVLNTYTQAPMNEPYVVALALQILLPKQIKVEKIKTGLRPKQD